MALISSLMTHIKLEHLHPGFLCIFEFTLSMNIEKIDGLHKCHMNIAHLEKEEALGVPWLEDEKMILDRPPTPTENFMPCASNALEVILMGDDNSVSLEESSNANASMKVLSGKETMTRNSETNDEDSDNEIGRMIYNSSETAKVRDTTTDAANTTLVSSRDTSSPFASIKSGGVERRSAMSDSGDFIQNKYTMRDLTTKCVSIADADFSEQERVRIDNELLAARMEEEKLILDSLETSGTFQPQIGLRRSPRRCPLNLPPIQLNDELIGDFIWGSNEIKQTLKWQEKESSHIKPKKIKKSKKRTEPLHRRDITKEYTNNDETFSLYTDIDKLHLNDVHILIRQEILEGYVVSIKHDRNSRPCHIQRYANTVGFRCKWCKHISLNGKSEMASVYPRRIGCIYSSVVRFQRHHIM